MTEETGASGKSGAVPTGALSLTGMREQLAADDAGKWDETVGTDGICFHGGRMVFAGARGERGFEAGLEMNAWATGQLCERLAIPAEFYRRNPPGLRDALANHWLGARREEKPGERWLVRSKGGEARAVLSPRYSSLDNLALLEAMLPLLPESRYQVKLSRLTGEAWHLRVIDRALVKEVQAGDPMFLGFDVVNSEVGACAVSLSACLWRQVCSNGLVRQIGGKGLLYMRHAGREPLLRLNGALEETLREAVLVGAAFLEQVVLTAKIPVPDGEKAIEAVAQEWRLPAHALDTAKWTLLREKPTDSLFAMINALTQASQTLPVFERVRVETLCASLIEAAVLREERSPASGLARRILSGKGATA